MAIVQMHSGLKNQCLDLKAAGGLVRAQYNMPWLCRNIMQFKVPGLKKGGRNIILKPNQIIDIETVDPEYMDKVFDLIEQGWLLTVSKENSIISKPEKSKKAKKTTKKAVYDKETKDMISKILQKVSNIKNTTVYNVSNKSDNIKELDETELEARRRFLESSQKDAKSNINNFKKVNIDIDASSKADELGDIDI
jgi:hypothetical protein